MLCQHAIIYLKIIIFFVNTGSYAILHLLKIEGCNDQKRVKIPVLIENSNYKSKVKSFNVN